jgi:Ca-activated chloride channel family protein
VIEQLQAALASVGIEAFARPGWIAAGLAAGVIWGVVHARRRPVALGLPSMAEARRAGARRIDWARGLGAALRIAAVVALGAVLAGPVGVHTSPPEPGHGLDLVLVVDASGSMRALDTHVGGEWRTRLDLARLAVSRFARHRASEGDRVALVVFGDSAFTQCPLTGDGDLLSAALSRVEAGVAGEATALGDALALAVKRATLPGGETAPGRVAVLLTDGRNNAGAVSVEVAIALAKSAGLRVHTVAIGSAGEDVAMETAGSVAGKGLRFERHDVDVDTLERIATASGGRFFEARRASDLEAVYREIDAIERIERPLPPRTRREERPEPLLALAGGFLLVEVGVTRIFRRRLP